MRYSDTSIPTLHTNLLLCYLYHSQDRNPLRQIGHLQSVAFLLLYSTKHSLQKKWPHGVISSLSEGIISIQTGHSHFFFSSSPIARNSLLICSGTVVSLRTVSALLRYLCAQSRPSLVASKYLAHANALILSFLRASFSQLMVRVVAISSIYDKINSL